MMLAMTTRHDILTIPDSTIKIHHVPSNSSVENQFTYISLIQNSVEKRNKIHFPVEPLKSKFVNSCKKKKHI